MNCLAYLAIDAVVDDRIGLSAIVTRKHLGELAGDARGQSVDLQQGIQMVSALGAARQHGVAVARPQRSHDRVLAAVAQPQGSQMVEAPATVHSRARPHAQRVFLRLIQI